MFDLKTTVNTLVAGFDVEERIGDAIECNAALKDLIADQIRVQLRDRAHAAGEEKIEEVVTNEVDEFDFEDYVERDLFPELGIDV